MTVQITVYTLHTMGQSLSSWISCSAVGTAWESMLLKTNVLLFVKPMSAEKEREHPTSLSVLITMLSLAHGNCDEGIELPATSYLTLHRLA